MAESYSRHNDWDAKHDGRKPSKAPRFGNRTQFFESMQNTLQRSEDSGELPGPDPDPPRWPTQKPTMAYTTPAPAYENTDKWRAKENVRSRERRTAVIEGNEMINRVKTQRWPGSYSLPGMGARMPAPRYADSSTFAKTCDLHNKFEKEQWHTQDGTLQLQHPSSVGRQVLSIKPSAPQWDSYHSERPEPSPVHRLETAGCNPYLLEDQWLMQTAQNSQGRGSSVKRGQAFTFGLKSEILEQEEPPGAELFHGERYNSCNKQVLSTKSSAAVRTFTDRPDLCPVSHQSSNVGPASFATHSSHHIGSAVGPKFTGDCSQGPPSPTPIKKRVTRPETPEHARRHRKNLPKTLKELNAVVKDNWDARQDLVRDHVPEKEHGKTLKWWLHRNGDAQGILPVRAWGRHKPGRLGSCASTSATKVIQPRTQL